MFALEKVNYLGGFSIAKPLKKKVARNITQKKYLNTMKEVREDYKALFAFSQNNSKGLSPGWFGRQVRQRKGTAVATKEQIKLCHLHTDQEDRLMAMASGGERKGRDVMEKVTRKHT